VLPVVLKTGNLYSCENLGWLNILKHFDLQFDNLNPTIPEWIQDAPKSFIQEFINGFIASGCLQYFTPNIDLDFQRLGLKLGQIFKLYQYGLTRQSITYFGSRAFIEDNYAWFAPIKITKRPVSLVPVFNFEVDIDNSYVVENICVHNCQAFSNAGKKKTFDDERGLLFDEIVRIAKVKRPRFMFLENVKHILKVGDGEVIEYIKTKISTLGYHLQIFEISPHNYGIPQQRERVYFVCVRNDIYDGTDIVIPEYTGVMNFESYLDKIEDIDPKYFIKGDVLDTLLAWDKIVTQFEVGEKISPTIMINDAYSGYTESDFQEFPDWKQDYVVKNKPLLEKYKTQFDPWYQENKAILKKREIYGKLEWQTGVIKENDSIFNHFIQIRQSGIRVKKAQYFPTLVAIAQIPIYGKEKRYITPRECARLQSFPADFKIPKDDKVSYKQFGNSVNVDNVSTIIRTTLKKYGVL
jgi:DNA (cytosine-5)-methyltransferase 1